MGTADGRLEVPKQRLTGTVIPGLAANRAACALVMTIEGAYQDLCGLGSWLYWINHDLGERARPSPLAPLPPAAHKRRRGLSSGDRPSCSRNLHVVANCRVVGAKFL